MGKYFGTDGVRGVANELLTPLLAYDLGRYGAYCLKQKFARDTNPCIYIGRDTRISGSMLESAFAAGACSVGVNTVLLGVVPTAAVAYLARKHGAVAGVVISASHNPAGDNGIKFFGGNGYKLPDNVEDEIESLIDAQAELAPVLGREIGVVTSLPQGGQEYCDYLQEVLACDLSGLKIVLDGANGAAAHLAPQLFRNFGAQVEVINCQPDGWNINAICGSTHPEALQQAVRAQGAHLGIAFDGDADRLIAVDERGVLIDGDQIMVICAKYLQQIGKLRHNTLTVTVMSNLGLSLAMQQAGIEVVQTQVGDRYVLESLLQTGGSLGGEQSGHIIFTDYNTTGDGFITALCLLRVLKSTGERASTLAAQMTRLPQVLHNVRVRSKEGWQTNAEITAAIQQAEAMLGSTGRVLVRPSGTEPLLRVMLEGTDTAALESLASIIGTAIEKALA